MRDLTLGQKINNSLAGIYIHIPFCKQACYYCDFHFSTNKSYMDKMVTAICQEIAMQKDYLGGELLETIYFGGGTPSILESRHLEKILEAIQKNFSIDPKREVTLEANPDDITKGKLKFYREVGINRFSIGIQSFNSGFLKYINRAHTADEAINSLRLVKEMGFENVSIDLIYGMPSDDHKIWQRDLEMAMSLKLPHISSYCLTIEKSTVFGNWLDAGKIKQVSDEFAAIQFEMLLETLDKNGYEQYEISNFALPGYISKHNSNYWRHKKYLGVGPGAHSFNLENRHFNVSHNQQYMASISTGKIPFSLEKLTVEEKINDYILTSLRTKWGCDLSYIKEKYDYDLYSNNLVYLQDIIIKNYAHINENTLYLTNTGKLLADAVTSELLIV